jgi:signal transduction histidine kinase
MEPKPASPHAAPSGREVVAFVEKAAAYAKANGRENALSAFMNPKGPFRREDLFIFAYDSSGTVLAHGGQPFLVGKNLIDMVDADGVEVLKELIALAGKGGGWLEYLWPDPDNGNAIEPKADYVLKVDDSWWLGSGRFENAKGDYLK